MSSALGIEPTAIGLKGSECFSLRSSQAQMRGYLCYEMRLRLKCLARDCAKRIEKYISESQTYSKLSSPHLFTYALFQLSQSCLFLLSEMS
jgi:hypothetical protein